MADVGSQQGIRTRTRGRRMDRGKDRERVVIITKIRTKR
jgi:hypothetical protein